ncbi:hypothetical protein SAMN05446635_7790 [Burkholderia sp. OK233]|nr:hypothetical protein SAMN05446635_7790 [Burkholderia sp. OK233]
MGEWDASGMDDRREEFAMLRHLAWEGAGLATSIGSTTFKKSPHSATDSRWVLR